MENKTGTVIGRSVGLATLRTADFVICALAGLLLATLPHLVMWMKSGKPYYISDYDDLCYLGFAGNAYFEHPFSIADPTMGSSAGSIMPYLQYAPGILPAKYLFGSPLWINFCWRVFAGLSIGLAWPLLLGQVLHRRSWVVGCALVLMTDAGMLTGHLLSKHLRLCLQIAMGGGHQIFASFPQILPQWRLITPGLSFAYLLVHFWAVIRLRQGDDRNRWLLAGVTYGLLFYDYFYYWTSATLALALIYVIDRPHRRAYLWTALIGSIIGFPEVLAGMHSKAGGLSHDWLARTDNFLPIARGSELLFPAAILIEVLITSWWVFRYRREYLYLTCMAVVSLLLMNHQVISGLQIQNFHYLYVCGPTATVLCLLLIHAIWQKFPWSQSRMAAVVLLGTVSVMVMTGCWLRVLETLYTHETLTIAKPLREYLYQRKVGVATPPQLVPRAVVAGDESFLKLGAAFDDLCPINDYVILFSPNVSDQELDRRLACNSVLQGRTAEQFEAEQREALKTNWGPESRSKTAAAARLQSQLDAYHEVSGHLSAALDHFAVMYLALAPEQAAVSPWQSNFELVQNGPTWKVYRRTR